VKASVFVMFVDFYNARTECVRFDLVDFSFRLYKRRLPAAMDIVACKR
jgi:hypothetical protein